MTPEPRPASVSIRTTSGFTFLITETICDWIVRESWGLPLPVEALGDGVGVSDEDGEDAWGELVPAGNVADGCGRLAWRPTRAATLAEPDVPQATTNSAMRTRDMTRATTRCI